MGYFSKGTQEDYARDAYLERHDPEMLVEHERQMKEIEKMFNSFEGVKFKPLKILEQERAWLIKNLEQ